MENINELLYMYHAGDTYALRRLVRYCRIQSEVNVSFVLQTRQEMTFMREDMIQEAHTAAVRAIDLYREDRGAGFSTFITVVIRRKAYNCLRLYYKNRQVLLDAVPLDSVTDTGSILYDCVSQNYGLFEPEYYTSFENAREKLLNSSHLFTVRELDAIRAYQKYETSDECADSLNCSRKTYNARLCSAKKKIRHDILKLPGQKNKHD
ncbi:MAG: hypothetical protein K6G61_08505 [Solobacterium sp.]|nr:hypothetical protein [Solobacterium sp.]